MTLNDGKNQNRWDPDHGEIGTSSLNRLQGLTDSIFAVVMVIMFTLIRTPKKEELTNQAVVQYLISQADVLLLILATFFVVGAYWYSENRQARYLRRTDGVHTWLTLFYLALVVILPFPNALTNYIPSSRIIEIFFSGMTFLVGLAAFFAWVYASRGHRLLRRDVPVPAIRAMTLELMVEPGVALLSIAAVFIHPIAWQISFLLIPLIMILLGMTSRRGLSLAVPPAIEPE